MSVSHHFQNPGIAPVPPWAKFWLGDATGFAKALQYWFWNKGLLLNPWKSAIVYFGTHGRLRQFILQQIITVGCRPTVNVSVRLFLVHPFNRLPRTPWRWHLGASLSEEPTKEKNEKKKPSKDNFTYTGPKTRERIVLKFCKMVGLPDVVTRVKSDGDRFGHFRVVESQISGFPIDFDSRPYNTLALPCWELGLR